MVLRALLALALSAAAPSVAAGSAGSTIVQPRPDPTSDLIVRLERAVAEGDATAIAAMAAADDAPGVRSFAAMTSTRPTRLIIKERDRSTLPSGAERLLIEVFAEYGNESAITTWRLDTAEAPPAPARRIAEMEQLTTVSGLYRLSLNPAKQFDVRNLTLRGTDLTLDLATGTAFVAETPDGPTAVVLLGRGRMRFSPSDAAEQTQVRIFTGNDAVTGDFDAAFVRIRPAEFPSTFPSNSLVARAVAPGDLRRANDVFNSYIGQTLSLELHDLSRDRWSLIPTPGDLIAEVRTRRLGSLTYARSSKDAEDISLFDRKRRRNIAVYASSQKLAQRGPFYNEDQLVDYDVLQTDLDASFSPDRLWVEGNARIKIRIRSFGLATLTLRLAEPLVVRNIVTAEFGRLLHLRVVGQNSVIVNLPTTLPRDTELSLNIVYGGRLEPQQIDGEGISLQQPGQGAVDREEIYIPVEPQYIYSNRSYWYPQNTVTDYTTAQLRIIVPAEYDVVASGVEEGPSGLAPGVVDPGQRARKLFVYAAEQPLRYLSCIISRFNRVTTRQVTIPATPRRRTVTRGPAEGEPDEVATQPPQPVETPAGNDTVTLHVRANPRQVGRARSLTDRAASIFEYYGSILGDAPYPTFILAVTERNLPGGHSPAYFAILNQPQPLSPYVWRNDPVAFEDYGPYFLAHEIAHQWWGQAIGWKNYHEQWLSEGFAQYFSALYAAHDRGDDALDDMLRQMRRWAIDQSDQGPVYLGYRLGHIKGDSRVFRAIVYNKGAMVLHMLRRLVGDEAFFAGLRGFYREWRFRKAGTDDFRVALERTSGRDLTAFFTTWIYGAGIPTVKFTSTIGGSEAELRFEHRGEVMPLPVTVTVAYADGSSEEIVVAVTRQVVEQRVPLKGPVRSIDVNRDHGAVAEFTR
jgi:hypothetical protein